MPSRRAAWVVALASAGLGTAVAGPLLPSRADVSVLVSTSAGPVVHQRVSGGASLTYTVTGPQTLYLKARRRLPGAEHCPPPIPVEVLGDGQSFLTLQVGQCVDGKARIHDAGGGAASAPDVARVDVPAGGQALVLRSPANAPDVFVVLSDAR